MRSSLLSFQIYVIPTVAKKEFNVVLNDFSKICRQVVYRCA